MNDLKFAFRQLTKTPGFTTVAVLTLALGIGANATIFSIINTILFKPVNVPHPEQLVGVYQHDKDNPNSFNLFSYADFTDLRSGKEAAFTDLFAFGVASVGLQGDLTERLSASLVSANYFSALGVPPALGRVFLPEEETSGAPVAVLSYSLWTRLGADPSLVGHKLKSTRGDITVIGVIPRGFTGTQLISPAIFLPIGMAEALTSSAGQPPARILTNRGDRRFMLTGRLKPGLSLRTADNALSVLNQNFAIPDPAEPKPRILVCCPPARFNFSNYPDRLGKELAPLASFAFGLSALVLLIACLNLANMMLARGAARRKEIAIRLALGAARRRILSQLLTEGFLLALLGGAAGLVVSVWATKLLAAFVYSGSGMPADFPKFDLSPDWRVLLTLLLVSGLATLFFALGPAWKLARLDSNSDLKRHASEDARQAGARRFGARELLAVGQMAAALALLVAAALFGRSAINAASANPGFQFGSNFYLSLDSTLTGYSVPQERELVRTALERLSALPGVESVSLALNIPFGDSSWGRGVQLGGAPPSSGASATLADGKELVAMYNVVGADYFRTIGLPLQQGREFEHREVETTNSPPVAIISQNLADQLWPRQNPLGRSIQFPSENQHAAPTVMTVVGVVPAINWKLFEKERPAEIYVPLGQDFQPNLKLHVRVAPGVAPAHLMIASRDALRQLDLRIPLTEIRTLAVLHRDGPFVRVARLGSMLFGAFGGLALLLSLLGIYGMKAYAVARRTREIGIRMALGATARDVVTMILRETALLAALGLGLGLVLALAVGKFAASYLYQVPTVDPFIYCVIPPLLLATVLVACVIPARRAARLDPMRALRYE
jgi:putative ABC transport system permease protein